MSWKPEVEGIEGRRRAARELGGADAVARQHARKRLTVRERVAGLVDPGSLDEVGPIAGHAETDESGALVSFTPANYVLALGRLDGRPCVVGGEDFTQSGGSPSPAGLRKSVYAEELALHYRVPLVRFLEGAGGSVRGAGRGKAGAPGDPVYAPHRFVSIARALETVPVVSAAVGAVAGLPAARLAASHFSVMTPSSQVLIAGPDLVERALGERRTKEELGGPEVHLRSGVVDNLAADETEVFALIRRFLDYLPAHAGELPPERPAGDDPGRTDEALLALIPRNRRRVYDPRRLIAAVLDRDSFLELTPLCGRSQVTGLARLDGTPVGVWANDPSHQGGAMTAAGARKVRRFVALCETFHLPMVSLVDEPGFMIGAEAEAAATIRHGVEAIAAVVRSTIPWVSVIVRRAYGVAAAAHFGPGGTVFTWPSAESGALPIEGGVAVAFRREIAAAPDPEKRRAELEEELARRRTPFPAAEGFSVHDLIDPRTTRPTLCRWLGWTRPLLRRRVR